MSDTMQAGYFIEPGHVEIREVQKPKPGPGEVLVRTKAVGICGSDMTIFRYGGIGVNKVTRPLIMGHEGSGVIAEVGPGVTQWKEGDAVVMEAGIPCRVCEWCKTGRYHLCPTVRFAGVPPTDGYMAEYVVMPSDFVYSAPPGLTFEEATLLEPLAIGLMAAREAEVGVGQSVAIFGAGPVGLMCLLAALVHGATKTFVVDVVPRRLNVALELGASEVINAKETDPVEYIVRRTNGWGTDRTLEAAGAPVTINMAIRAVKRGGTVGLVGVAHQPEIPIDVVRVVRSGLHVQGVFRYANIHPIAVDVVRAGRVNLKPFVTHTWPLTELQQALEFTETQKDAVIKGVVTIG